VTHRAEGLEGQYLPASSGPSAAGAAAVVVIAQRPGCRIQVGSVTISYGAAPAAGRLTIADTGGPRYDADIVGAGPYDPTFPDDGLTFEAGQLVTVTGAGGGGAVICKVSCSYRYVRMR
jgi:hypothetical protein